MNPQIRYMKSADGTTLAAATLGSKPVLKGVADGERVYAVIAKSEL